MKPFQPVGFPERNEMLKGKDILVVGPVFESTAYTLALKAAGAEISHVAGSMDALEHPHVDEALKHIRGGHVPDAVVIFQPHMKRPGSAFGEEPALRLAAALKEEGVPAITMDTRMKWNFRPTEQLAMQDNQMHYHAISRTPPKALVEELSRLLVGKSGPEPALPLR